MKLKLAIAGALMTVALAAPASAHIPRHGGYDWQMIGTRDVGRHGDRDIIPVYGHERFSQIKICVFRKPVRFYDLDIVFRNGSRQDVGVRHVLRPGECTRAIDLNGRRRDIKFVSLAYDTIGRHFGHQAAVRVYAR
jgi:hypothetical protein